MQGTGVAGVIVSPLDVPVVFALGVLVGLAYRWRLRRHNEDWFVVLGALVIVAFWTDILLAVAFGFQPWGVAPMVRVESPVLAVCYPLAYPLWFWLGGQTAFLFFGRRPEEGGALWVYRIEDNTDDFDPSWDS